MDDLYQVTPRKLFKFLCRALVAGLVPMVHGSPGIGKSDIMRMVAKEFNLKLLDFRTSTADTTDANGLPGLDPKTGFARFVPFADTFPVVGMDLPFHEGVDPAEGYTYHPDGSPKNHYSGWLVFFDEINSGSKAVQASFYKIILDRLVGNVPLHPCVAMAAAGNLATDRAIVNELSTAMKSRLVHFRLKVSLQEWMEDVALKQGYDERIVAYLNYKKGNLFDFRPDSDENTFCCPRTWSFVNRLIQGQPVTHEDRTLLAGVITSGTAVDFVTFTEVFADLASIQDVVANPGAVPVPETAASRWALVTHLLGEVDATNFTQVKDFMVRFPVDFQILFLRSVVIRHPDLRRHPAFGPFNRSLEKHLAEDQKEAA